MSLEINHEAFLKRFGLPVVYNSCQDITGIYDETVLEIGGVDSIAETLKVKTSDLPNLSKGDTFDFCVNGVDSEYKAKSFNPERSGFTTVILERQP